jgi:hypothetical protein
VNQIAPSGPLVMPDGPPGAENSSIASDAAGNDSATSMLTVDPSSKRTSDLI